MSVFPREEDDERQASDDDQRQAQNDGAQYPVERGYARAGVNALVASLRAPGTLEHALPAVVVRFALHEKYRLLYNYGERNICVSKQ